MNQGAGARPSLANARLTIDLGALVANWRSLAALAPSSETSAVVKADAYGIGVARAVPALAAAGCRTFFVATAPEGIEVRAAAPPSIVYVLDGLPPGGAAALAEHRLRPVLGTPGEITEWAAFRAEGGDGDCAVHFDTGMNRLGLGADEAEALLADPRLLRLLSPALVMSHLACADVADDPLNALQLGRFRELVARVPLIAGSLANSAGILLGPKYHFALNRPGIMLYGGRGPADRPPLRTVVTAEARVLQVRHVDTDTPVGYGATERTRRPSVLATIGAGYADGYHRLGSSSDSRLGGKVFIRGRRAPLVGRVSMDLVVADVTDVPEVVPGDWAELFGPSIPLDEAASAAATIGYEFLTGLGRRYDRRFVGP
ncbi:MAG: alanine racemase [Bauldia sp.]|nr:alanine racemase [Bauldia sp.]